MKDEAGVGRGAGGKVLDGAGELRGSSRNDDFVERAGDDALPCSSIAAGILGATRTFDESPIAGSSGINETIERRSESEAQRLFESLFVPSRPPLSSTKGVLSLLDLGSPAVDAARDASAEGRGGWENFPELDDDAPVPGVLRAWARPGLAAKTDVDGPDPGVYDRGRAGLRLAVEAKWERLVLGVPFLEEVEEGSVKGVRFCEFFEAGENWN